MEKLAPQAWMADAQPVMDALEAARAGSARFVGGCVRNALLGEPVSDVDIATQLTPDEVEAACRAAGLGVHPTGVEHGTLTITANHKPFEVTTLRRDVETDGRRAVVAFTQDWAEDAQRRDFRMNAIYADREGVIFDPTGGLQDIAERRVVFVGDADTRIREDYLRILRFFRFQAWYGREAPDAAGLEACGRLRAGLAGISAERIWVETKKLLGAPAPLATLEAMAAGGVLGQLFPEAKGLGLLTRLVTLETYEQLAPDVMTRFLSLFWQDGEAVRAVAARLKVSNEERDRLGRAAADTTPLHAESTTAEIHAAVYRSGWQVVRDKAMLGWAESDDIAWAEMLVVAETWPAPTLPLSGADLLAAGREPGPAIGEALRKAEEAWISSDFILNREELLSRI